MAASVNQLLESGYRAVRSVLDILFARMVWVVRQWGAASAAPDCAARLARTVTDLEALNCRTEKDFLAIGGKLTGLVAAARRLSSDMASLERIFGSQDSHASEVLGRVLERSRQIEGRAETGNQVLTGICDSARQIGRTFRSFQDMVAVFRVLGSLTRIETARLGNAGGEFASLAEEVSTLTKGIEASGQRILEASVALQEKMNRALAKVTGLRGRELAELPGLINEVTTGLSVVEQRHRRTIEIFLHHAAEYEKVSAAFEDLISAIQFHDITRQQIEHVCDVLRRLQSGSSGNGREPGSDRRAVLTLQSSQLANAGQVFGASAGRIERDLDGIMARVREMAATSQTLVRSSGDDADASFLQLEGRLSAILNVVAACTKAEAEIEGGLTELTQAVTEMQNSIGEILEVEVRIRRIAINATIRAVQIGDAGNALTVIAEVMQRLASDTDGLTGTVGGQLETMRDAAQRLISGASRVGGAEAGAGDLLTEMRAAMSMLHSSGEASLAQLDKIVATSASLADEIQSVRTTFTAGTLVAAAVDRARSTIEEISGHYGSADPGAATEARLEDFQSHYTMKAERDVHESVSAGRAGNEFAPDETPGAVAEQAVAAGSELGDNVELF